MEEKKKMLILPVIIGLLIATGTFFDYKSDYYSSISQSSSNYINFVISYYQASHFFCDINYTCIYSNLTFPELQQTELQKFQDQIDWTSKKATTYRNLSSLFIFSAIILNLYFIYYIYKNEDINPN